MVLAGLAVSDPGTFGGSLELGSLSFQPLEVTFFIPNTSFIEVIVSVLL